MDGKILSCTDAHRVHLRLFHLLLANTIPLVGVRAVQFAGAITIGNVGDLVAQRFLQSIDLLSHRQSHDTIVFDDQSSAVHSVLAALSHALRANCSGYFAQ